MRGANFFPVLLQWIAWLRANYSSSLSVVVRLLDLHSVAETEGGVPSEGLVTDSEGQPRDNRGTTADVNKNHEDLRVVAEIQIIFR